MFLGAAITFLAARYGLEAGDKSGAGDVNDKVLDRLEKAFI
jgi:hypothetical protein